VTDIHWHSSGLAEVPDDLGWLADVERDRFTSMRFPKRRFDALLGRWTAKNCVVRVLELGSDPQSLAGVVVKNATDGAPEVFVSGKQIPWVIAMTDRADWGVSALRQGEERIGCDLELVEPRSALFVEDYFTPKEQRVVKLGDPSELANLIWSAKESALKVLRTGLRRDTRTVEVRLGTDRVDGWSSLAVTVDGHKVLPGWWIRYGSFLLTFVSVSDDAPPASLFEPPPLANALPSNTWMD
jgi:4'-phosphopantetheinyl transferase